MKKKIVVAIIVISIAGFSFLAGGRYEKGRSTGNWQPNEAIDASAVLDEEGENSVEVGPGTVEVSPERQQLLGVKVASVEKKQMTYTLRLYGRVVPDETKIYRVNASTDCWIREISDVTTGSIVRKNQILAEALAPAYYNAQVTYLIALDNTDRIRQQLGGQTRHQQADLANNQIRTAVQALQNLGITDAQTEDLANKRQARPYLQVRSPSTGVVLSRKLTLNQWFKAAEEFFTVADIRRVWAYADVYEDEAMHMRPGMTVVVRHGQMGKTFKAKVGEVLPLFDPTARTLKVRIDVDNPRYDLRPDMFVDVEIPITLPPSVNVPTDAVLDSGTTKVVYVDKGNGIFEPRRVKTGWCLGGQVEITDGLMPGEKMVVSGNFLIDSESRMTIAASGAETKRTGDQASGGQVREKRMEGKKRDRPSMPATDRSWMDMLGSARGRRDVRDGSVESRQKTRDGLGRYATSPSVVDWNGPDKEGTPARDWSGWGKFPGADDLGIKRQTSKNSSLQSNSSKAVVKEKTAAKEPSTPEVSPAVDDHGPGMESGSQDPPAAPQTRSSQSDAK